MARGLWCTASLVATLASLTIGPRANAETRNGLANARLTRPAERFAVARAIDGAARQLAHDECQGLLDEFADTSGRPLRVALEAHGMGASDYLYRVFFYDAPAAVCGTSNLAITTPGSRAVFVCGPRFARQMARDSRHAEATLIHELLHSLGLGENPPSSDQITSRVLARCGQRGPTAAARHAPAVQ